MKLLKLAFIVVVLLGMRWAFAYNFTTTYSYSTVSRLTGAVYGTGNSINYCYDLNGNRLELNNGSATDGIGLTAAAVTVVENRNSLVIPVVRTGNLGATASVSYSTANGTGISGRDYTAVSGILTWAPNDSCAKFITVPLQTDFNQEPDRTFIVNLSNAMGAPLTALKKLTVTLVNDDQSGTLAIASGTVLEANGYITLNVNRSGGASGAVSVRYATANGTATAGTDYTAASGTLTWSHGDMAAKPIAVPILEDTQVDPDETFTVTLSNPAGGATLAPAMTTATVTIQDNDCRLLVAQPIGWNIATSGSLQTTDSCGVKGYDYFTDEYTFNGSAGQVVSISYGSGEFDNYLYLLGPDGRTLASDDDSGGNSDSLINYALPANGVYRIQATSYGLRSTGAYAILLTSSSSSKTDQTIGSITLTPATLAVGGVAAISATATSGLAVTFISSTPDKCTTSGVNGKTVTGIAAGACIITASQVGNTSYNAAPLRLQTFAVAAAPSAPAVALAPAALTFSARQPGTSSPAQTVTLRNTGTAILNITGIAASGDFARTTTCGATLAAGASCTISVTFTPTAMGVRTGAVTLTSNAPGSPHRIALTGTGKGARYDFNGDGKSDLLWRNTTTGANQIWFMNGAVNTSTATTTTVATNWSVAGVDDFNGDGKADILWRDAAGQSSIWLMNGATRISATPLAPIMAAPWTFAGTGDFNGDGKADILLRNTTTGANQVWLMNGAARIGAPINAATQAITWAATGIADFNGDGKADILWRNASLGQNQIWFMNGATMVSSAPVPGTILAPWIIAGTGDFNADGKADILWRNPNNGMDTIWFMNGAAATGATTTTAATTWSIAGVADFNGDGKADITWRSPTTGATQLWLMNGATRSATADLTPTMLLPWGVAK